MLKSELGTFVEKEDKIEADSGCKDDRVMATVHALIVLEKAGVMARATSVEPSSRSEPDPFSFEALFKEFGEEQIIAGTPARFH